jgi:hypothetical protein
MLLWLSLMCCVFEGAARKWLVGETSVAGRLAYLSKDIVMAGFLLQHASRNNRLTVIAQPFLTWGLVLLAVGALFSSVSGINPVGAALTIRTFIVLPLAATIAGQCLPANSLRRYAWWVSILAVLICPLGVLQFFSPEGSPINRYSTEGESHISTAGVSERVRATGTFSYITGFGEFAELGVWAGIVTFSLAKGNRERWIGYAGVIAGLLCSLVTVSRAVVLISCGLVGVWALFGGQVGRKLQSAFTIAIVIVAALSSMDWWNAATEITSTVYLRHESARNDSVSHRLWYQFVLPLYAIDVAPMGNGLGSEQQGRTVDIESQMRGGWTFESPWGRTIMELGVVGFIGFLISWGIAFAPWREAYKVSLSPGSKTALAVTGAALAARAMLGFQFNHVAGYFFWSMAACVLALGNTTDTIENS